MKTVLIILRILGAAAAAFLFLVGGIGLSTGESNGLAVALLVVGAALLFGSLYCTPAARAEAQIYTQASKTSGERKAKVNRESIVPIIGISLLVVMALSRAVMKYNDAHTVEYMMSVREYVPETVTPRPAPTTKPDPLAGISLGRKNAIKSAESYLKYSSFSRKGLVDQLRFEGYTSDEAIYACDYLEPDWYAEAAEAAASYLRYSSFSRQGLIDQLLFDGFTEEEAEYGVVSAGY